MKRFIFTLTVAMLALHVTASVVLTISKLDNGTCQIIAPGNTSPSNPVRYVLQVTTNFVTWTSIRTNLIPIVGYGDGVTNIVQITNPMAFYRVRF